MFRWIIMAALAIAALPAHAQTFPSKAVHLIVAYAPGGTGDVVARIIADKLGPALGQTVVVENRAGASGAIGATAVVNAPADGHKILADPETRQKLLDAGANVPLSTEQFAAFVAAERAKYQRIIRETGIKPE